MCPLHPECPPHLPPYLIPLGCHRAPALYALLHASIPHWLTILHMQCIQFNVILSKYPTLFFIHRIQKFALYHKYHIMIQQWSDILLFFPVNLFPILISPIFSFCAKTKFIALLYWENGIRQEIILFNTVTNQPHPQPYFSLFFFFCSSDSIYISQDVIIEAKQLQRDKDIRNLLKGLGLKKLVDLVEKTVQAYFLCQMIRLKSLQLR